jgi:RNase P subunit RPR2
MLYTSELSKSLRRKINHCEKCNIGWVEGKGLHMHHKDQNNRNNNRKNLIVLCPSCHKHTHMDMRRRGITPPDMVKIKFDEHIKMLQQKLK